MSALPKNQSRHGDYFYMNPTISALRRDFLKKQGWSDDVMSRHKLTVCPNVPADTNAPVLWNPKFHGQLGGHPYVAIPYPDLNGEPLMRHVPAVGALIPFVRARLLEFKGKKGKYQSYKGAGVAIYCPASEPWEEIAADPSQPICITEGEFDAITACENGITCLGISGVDCFAPKGGIAEPVGPDRFVWAGRQVTIVFDQDEDSTEAKPYKPSVMSGAGRIEAALCIVGAKVGHMYFARTRAGKEHRGQKMGFEEYFKAGGTVDELAETFEKPQEIPVLAELILRYGMTRKGDVLDGETGELMKFAALQNVYAPHHRPGEKGGKIYVANDWKDHRNRFLVERVVLEPDLATGFTSSGLYNQWQGFATVPAAVADPEAVAAFEILGKRLFNESWPWARGHYAHLLQFPGVKAYHAVILQSPVGGIAKSLFNEIIGEIIGPRHARKVQPDRLFHKFGGHLNGAVFLWCDELQSDYARHEDTLKDMISSEEWEIEGKGTNLIVVPNRVRIAISTNRPYAMKMDKDARRLLVQRPSVSQGEKVQWQEWVHSNALRLKKDPEWRASVMTYLLGIDLTADGAYSPIEDAPWTIHRSEMAHASNSVKEFDSEGLYDKMPDVFALTKEMRTRAYGEAKDKYVMDLVAQAAPYRVESTVKVEGKVITVMVYSKTAPLPLTEYVRKTSTGKADGMRMKLTPGQIKVSDVLAETQKALGVPSYAVKDVISEDGG